MDQPCVTGASEAFAQCRRRTAACAAALLCIAAFAGAAAAAERAGDKWTLEELVAVALERNPGLAAARSAASAVKEDIGVARGERLPRLDAVGRAEYFPRRERLLIFRHGFRKDDNPFEDAVASYGLEISLPLYTSGRIEHGISLAKARAEAARFRSALARNELIFNVASTYYTALRLQRVIAAQETTLKSLKESRRVTQLQQEVGRLAPLDKLRLETRVSQGERDLAGARNAYAQAIEVLKALINVPAELFLDVGGELSAARTPVALDRLREQALSNRPDIIALKKEVLARREAVGVAEARLGPTADFKASYRGVTGFDDGTTKDDAQLFLLFRMPLYEGGVLKAKKRKASARLKEAEFRLWDAERRALAELERAALDLKSAAPRITAARRAVNQAEESLRVERQNFTQGRGTSNDLLLAEEVLLRARTQLAAALSDSQIARAALNLAAGLSPVSTPSAPAGRPGKGG